MLFHVVDGDTIDVLTDQGFRVGWEQRVRLHGVDTYELNDPDPALRALAVKGKDLVVARIEGEDVILNTFKDGNVDLNTWRRFRRLTRKPPPSYWGYTSANLKAVRRSVV